jgi:hypothetical protein
MKKESIFIGRFQLEPMFVASEFSSDRLLRTSFGH